jgi:hypothetical protein
VLSVIILALVDTNVQVLNIRCVIKELSTAYYGYPEETSPFITLGISRKISQM